MKKLVECVPNFSEGRNQNKIGDIVKQMSDVSGITVLDVDSGPDTNRTVVTIVGSPEAVGEAAFQGIKRASEVLDMSQHCGTHPRMGATDVCHFIPVCDVTIEECVELSKLPDIRKGEYEGLAEKLTDANWKPDFGPAKLHIKAGATVMGCREFLIAYNINLNTKDHRLATDIAFELREAGRSKRTPNPNSKNLLDGEIVRNEDGSPVKVSGMFKDVKGIGWYVDIYNRAQISINFNNFKVSTIHDVFDAACILANERGIRVTGSELVGLIPLEALLMAGRHYLNKQNRSLGIPTADIVECAVQSLGLNDVTEFDPNVKIIDYAVQSEDRPLMNLVGKEFVEELSTNSPAPGGGSVSALAGALGAALSSMVAALSHEKKELLDLKPEMNEIGIEAQNLKDRLSFLVVEQTAKNLAIEIANKYAIEIPMETAKKCFSVIELADTLVEKGNPNSVSDAGVAAEVALAGVSGACMNVLINLTSVEDESYCDDMKNKVEDIMEKAESLQKVVFEKTMNIIND